jgi:hypothetical protein
MYGVRNIVTAGGLISYGIDRPGQFRQVAGYVDRILRGTQVSDLPVERASKFKLAINLKDRQGTGPRRAPDLARPRRRGDRITVVFAAVREAGNGTQRRFVAVQHNARSGRRSGRSADAAGTAVPDPERTPDAQRRSKLK